MKLKEREPRIHDEPLAPDPMRAIAELMIEKDRARRSLARTVSGTDAKVLIRGIREEQRQRKNGITISVHVMMGSGVALDRRFPAGSLYLCHWTTTKNQSSNQYSYSPSLFFLRSSQMLFLLFFIFFPMYEVDSSVAA